MTVTFTEGRPVEKTGIVYAAAGSRNETGVTQGKRQPAGLPAVNPYKRKATLRHAGARLD